MAPAESRLQSGGMAMVGDDELMQALPLPEMLSMPAIKHEAEAPSQAVTLAGCITQAAPHPVPVLASVAAAGVAAAGRGVGEGLARAGRQAMGDGDDG